MKLQVSDRRRPASLNAAAAEIAAAVFLHVAFWVLAASMLQLELAPLTITLTAFLPVVLYLLARIHGFGKLLPVYVVLLPILAFFAAFQTFKAGFLELYNYLTKAVNEVHGLTIFPVGEGYPDSTVTSAPVQYVVILLSFLMAGLWSYAICRKVKWLALPVTVVPALAGFAAGLLPSKAAFVFYMVAATFYLILLSTRSRGTARRLTWLNGEISAALLVFLVILSLLLSGFTRSEAVEHLREKLAQNLTSFRYEPEDQADGMPGGDLNSADRVQYDGSTVLVLETPEAFSMYLKGMTGERLKDGTWTSLSDNAYMKDYSVVQPWVHSSAFSPNRSYGQLLDLKDRAQTVLSGDDKKLLSYKMQLKNERAFSDRIFYPYELSGDSNVLHHANDTFEGLSAEGLRGQRDYTLETYKPVDYEKLSVRQLFGTELEELNNRYREDDAAEQILVQYGKFTEAEKSYRTFVKQNYSGEKAVPKEYRDMAGTLLRNAGGAGDKQLETIYRVRNLFSKNYTYSLDADNTEGKANGADPLLTFATETKTGYDAHFASLAVLLFREAGIPARYAEGYFLSEELLQPFEGKTGTEDNPLVVNIPDSAAHAWVEVYKNGIGWLPVEVTPGYYETNSGTTAAGTATREETVQPEEVPEPQDAGNDTAEDGGGQEEEPDATSEKEDRSFVLLFLLFLLLLLLVPLFWHQRLRRKIAHADSAEAVGLAYRYLLKRLRRAGLNPNENRLKDTGRWLGDYKKPFEEALELFDKETFSEEGLQDDERKAVCGFVLDLTGNVRALQAARKRYKEQMEEPHGK